VDLLRNKAKSGLSTESDNSCSAFLSFFKLLLCFLLAVIGEFSESLITEDRFVDRVCLGSGIPRNSQVGDWQEGCMEKLCKEYIALLNSDKLPSDRFWELEKRIREDKRATGVVVTNSRSKMIDNILDLLHESAVTLEDLSDFSEELQEKIRFIYSGGYNTPDNCSRL